MGHSAGISNVLLITVDSLRADAVGAYDADRHTPEIDALAEAGTTFDRAFATGNWTPFSFPAMLSSRPVFAETGEIGITESQALASVLSEAGVSTGGFNAANGFLTSHWGYDAGFEEFEPFVASVGSSIYSRYLATHPTVEAWMQWAASPLRRAGSWLRGETDDRPFLDTSRLSDVEHAAKSFIQSADAPFFLWVHYMDAHTPYVPAPRYIREVSSTLFGTHRMLHAHFRTGLGLEVGERTLEDLRTLYQAAVRQVDASIGRLRETLEANGLADDTAIVIAGDHGEEFLDHGHLSHYPKLYDELIRVPLIVDVPGDPPRCIDRQVSLASLPPTIADLLDVESHPDWEGESLAPTVSTGEQPADEPVVTVTVRGEEVTTQPIPRSLSDGDLLISVRDSDWTYIENTETGDHELYHRPSDPTQQSDCAAEPTAEQRAVIDRFSRHAANHLELLGDAHRHETADDAVGDDLTARLEALGYK